MATAKQKEKEKRPKLPDVMTVCEALWLALTDPAKAKAFLSPLLADAKKRLDADKLETYDNFLWAAAAYAGMWDALLEDKRVLQRIGVLRLLGSAATDLSFLRQNVNPMDVKRLVSRMAFILPPQAYQEVRMISALAAKLVLGGCDPSEDDAWIPVLMEVLAYEDDPAILSIAVRRITALDPVIGVTMLLVLLDRLSDEEWADKVRSIAVEVICLLADKMVPSVRRSLAATSSIYDNWIRARFQAKEDYRLLQDAPLDKLMALWDHGCLSAPQAIKALRGRPHKDVRKALRKFLKAKPVEVVHVIMGLLESVADLPTARIGLSLILRDKAINKLCRERLTGSGALLKQSSTKEASRV